ncbi:MAG: hypothetical protein ABI690_35675 [Chloroflexota bacterium]
MRILCAKKRREVREAQPYWQLRGGNGRGIRRCGETRECRHCAAGIGERAAEMRKAD